MDQQKNNKQVAPSNEYKRSRRSHAFRMFGMLVIAVLNIAVVMSAVERHSHGIAINWARESITFLFVLFIDVTLLMPIVFEVDQVRVNDDKLVLKVLVFTREIPWSEIVEFKTPPYLKVSIIRTRRCFYLINKRQFERYEELARAVTTRLTLPAPKA